MDNKKYLASANTTSGFINKFDNILKQKKAFTFILKGGPGTGKSTFMKEIGRYFENINKNVEYFYCSSDSESLDGIKIDCCCVVDGTSPHTMDATLPNIKEKIINLGNYIGFGVKQYKTEIEKNIKLKQLNYKRGYLYLSALGKLFEVEKTLLKTNKNLDKLILIKQKLKLSKNKTLNRELFSSFICKEGYKSFYKDNNYKNKIVLSGNFIENSEFFEKLTTYLTQNNIKFTKFPSIFLTDNIEGVLINNLDLLVVCESAFYENFVNFKNKVLIEKLIKKIGKTLNNAIISHKKVEKFYIENMNFDGVKLEREKVIKEIEEIIK